METTVDECLGRPQHAWKPAAARSDGYDSLLDMKAGVTNVTVSYNHYRNSSRAGLIGSSDDDAANTNITFHHNWYENIEQRTPLLRHGLVHTYNNYLVERQQQRHDPRHQFAHGRPGARRRQLLQEFQQSAHCFG